MNNDKLKVGVAQKVIQVEGYIYKIKVHFKG
jgi:hypothetical protein